MFKNIFKNKMADNSIIHTEFDTKQLKLNNIEYKNR